MEWQLFAIVLLILVVAPVMAIFKVDLTFILAYLGIATNILTGYAAYKYGQKMGPGGAP